MSDSADILESMTRCMGALVAVWMLALAEMPTVPDNTEGSVASCSSEVLAGVEVDNCVANPNAPAYGDAPRFGVELETGVGLG